MADEAQIFKECVEKNFGRGEMVGAGTMTQLSAAFACMRSRLEEAKAADNEKAHFISVIAEAIKTEPGLATDQYRHDRDEFLRSLELAFANMPYDGTLKAGKMSFLHRVNFSLRSK